MLGKQTWDSATAQLGTGFCRFLALSGMNNVAKSKLLDRQTQQVTQNLWRQQDGPSLGLRACFRTEREDGQYSDMRGRGEVGDKWKLMWRHYHLSLLIIYFYTLAIIPLYSQSFTPNAGC